MSKIANVVDGEASESDSEIEVGKSPDAESPDHAKSFVIAGEAPESDDESKISVQKSKEPDLPLYGATVSPPSSPSNIYTSLLHQKLWENNVLLRATLEGLIKHTTEISVEKLTRADKILLNVQECIRATNANIALALARLKQVQSELNKANCKGALPNVKIRS